MLPERVVFATNVSERSGAGHFRRLIEISKQFPDSLEKYFFGATDIAWVKTMAEDCFLQIDTSASFGFGDLVILDSYEEEFCKRVNSLFSNSYMVQIADRYTNVLTDSKIVFMDLPFFYEDSLLRPRVIAHGIEFFPSRSFGNLKIEHTDKAKRVLITTGGVVNEKIFTQLIFELSHPKYREISFEFIGRCKPFESKSPNLNFHNFGDNFDWIARDCDTSISAAGTTLWDLLANRKLIGLMATVDNQMANFDYAIQNRQAIEIFTPKNLQLNVDSLHTLLFDSNMRRSLREEISGRYDFLGAGRVTKVILNDFSRSTA